MDEEIKRKIREYEGLAKYFLNQKQKLEAELALSSWKSKIKRNKKREMILDPKNRDISDSEMAKMAGCTRQHVWKLRSDYDKRR